jgi:hypothetical protein
MSEATKKKPKRKAAVKLPRALMENMLQRQDAEAEQPRAEPEIIPPRDPRRRTPFDDPDWIARVGPFGAAMLAITMGAIAATILLLLVGTLLIIAAPFAASLLVLAVIARLLWPRRR